MPFEVITVQHAEALSGIPKCKKAVMCLTWRVPVLDRLGSGQNESAAGCEFDVNESEELNMVSLKETPIKQGYILIC